MDSDQSNAVYAVETFGVFALGLSVMLLALVSAWAVSNTIIDQRSAKVSVVGEAPVGLNIDTVVASVAIDIQNGQVAGVIDDSSLEEQNLRNDVAAWLSSARVAESLPATYRDSILDRNAQNHARSVSDACALDRYSNWSESLGLQLDEGVAVSFSESIFPVNGTAFASTLPAAAIEYQRLFTDFDTYGVGVASATETANCGTSHILVIHTANVR